jgi:hypothetical protein
LKFNSITNNTEYTVSPANNQITGAVVIPTTYEGRPVVYTVQGSGSFENITGITSLTILNSNRFAIQNYTFRGCTGLTSVFLTANVIVGHNAFRDCTNLTSVTFGEGTTVNASYSTTFPGDLVAKYNARTGGGPGVYTRPSGSNTWTRIGNAPAAPPAPVIINTSLNGVWEMSNGMQITVNGNSGVVSNFGSTSALTQDAINKGYLKLGDQRWRNIINTGNLTWSGQQLNIDIVTSRPNVATGTIWVNVTFTMSADGRTIDVSGNTFTRK